MESIPIWENTKQKIALFPDHNFLLQDVGRKDWWRQALNNFEKSLYIRRFKKMKNKEDSKYLKKFQSEFNLLG